MIIRLLIFAFLLLSGTITGQKKFTFNQGTIASPSFHEVIPFEYYLDKIIIEATIDGHKGRYILDTGAMCIIFKDSGRVQAYESIREMHINDANDRKKKTDIVKLKHVQLGKLNYRNLPALYIEPFKGALKCFDVDGLLGSNLLRFGAMKVDMIKQEIHLASSYADFGVESKEGVKMVANKIQSSPLITLMVNGIKQKHVLIDTGSGGIFAFNHQLVKKMQKKGVLVEPAYISSGTNSQGAWGADSALSTTKIWEIDHVDLAGTHFNNLLLRSDQSSMRIGMELLENGEFILDYPQKRFFFTPYEKERPRLSVGGFGVDFASINDTIRVNGIWSGSEAAKAGIEKGDVLIDVTGFNLRGATQCEMFYELKMHAKMEAELEFVLQRKSSGEEYMVRLNRIK